MCHEPVVLARGFLLFRRSRGRASPGRHVSCVNVCYSRASPYPLFLRPPFPASPSFLCAPRPFPPPHRRFSRCLFFLRFFFLLFWFPFLKNGLDFRARPKNKRVGTSFCETSTSSMRTARRSTGGESSSHRTRTWWPARSSATWTNRVSAAEALRRWAASGRGEAAVFTAATAGAPRMCAPRAACGSRAGWRGACRR